MESAIWLGGMVVWLALGGFGFAIALKELDEPQASNEGIPALFFIAVSLGPFLAGAAVAILLNKRRALNSQDGGRG